ncbi:MAG TPA: protein kinase, partial [Thermoanaerobaculia bacterium]|nr:protein kinase [Thermoanaerobaculia bacterium]
MGEVFLALDSSLDRRVAIKRIRQDKLTPIQRERLLREAQAAAKLSHPNIVGVYQMLKDADGNDCIVMEHVEGPTLAHALLENGPWKTLPAVLLAKEITSGLAAAHTARIIHRDLKTENVMLTLSGHAKILDFGLAKPIVPGEGDTTLTESHCLVGTCRSMSPEQVRSQELDERSDLFSLGVLLYEMLTGEPPFHGASATATLAQVLSHQPPRVNTLQPEVSPRLSSLVARLLEKDPACRPQNAEEVIQELETITADAFSDETLSDLPTGYYKPPSKPPSGPVSPTAMAPESTAGMSVHKRIWWLRTATVSALCLVLLGGIAVLVWPLIPAPSHPPIRPAIPSIRVVVREPELNDKDERLQLAASAVSTATLSTLNSLSGVTTLDYDKFIGQPPTDQRVALAAAADEVLKATVLKKTNSLMEIKLYRIRGSDGQLLWEKTLTEPIESRDLLHLSQDVTLQLVHGYREYPPHLTAFLATHTEDFNAFLIVKRRLKTQLPSDDDLTLLQDVMDNSPGILEARFLAADILLTLYQSTHEVGRLDRALRLVQGARKLAPNDTRWLISQFKIELEKDPPEVATQTLARIEKHFPSGHPLILSLQAKLEEKEGHMDQALADQRKVASISPTRRNLVKLVDWEIKAGSIEQARNHLDWLLKETPNDAWSLSRLAELELCCGDLSKAEHLYLDLTSVTGAQGRPHGRPAQALLTNLGVTQVLLHHYQEARTSFERALIDDPNQVEGNLNLAEAQIA